jgi:site-specific recombinase XerD
MENAAWVKAAIDAWTHRGRHYRGENLSRGAQGRQSLGEDLTPGAVLQIVQQYARAMGLEKLAPHDHAPHLRQALSRAGRDLEQIKFLLGHASIQTTERYLGAEQDFTSAVNDNLGLER